MEFISIHLEGGREGGGGSNPGNSQSDVFWFTGRWPGTNRTEGNYKRQFTVLLSVYKHTV